MNYLEMQVRVKRFVQNRPSLDDLIKEVINEECDKLAMPFEFRGLQHVEVVTYPVDVDSFDLDDEPYAITRVRDLTHNRTLSLQDDTWYDDQDFSYKGLPGSFVHFGHTIALHPHPYEPVDLRIRSKRLPVPMVDDEDVPDGFPRDWHTIICKLAASEVLFLLREDQAGMTYKNAALADISARQEERTIEMRNTIGRMTIDRSHYFRGQSGSRPKWR